MENKDIICYTYRLINKDFLLKHTIFLLSAIGIIFLQGCASKEANTTLGTPTAQNTPNVNSNKSSATTMILKISIMNLHQRQTIKRNPIHLTHIIDL
jgi:hypothetical protein